MQLTVKLPYGSFLFEADRPLVLDSRRDRHNAFYLLPRALSRQAIACPDQPLLRDKEQRGLRL